MGGEYPLASSHSAESSDSGKGARNIALLYLFGSGGGSALVVLITYLLDLSGMQPQYIWRVLFGIGALFALIGLLLRFFTIQNSQKSVEAAKCCRHISKWQF